jgi:hypothetical protein
MGPRTTRFSDLCYCATRCEPAMAACSLQVRQLPQAQRQRLARLRGAPPEVRRLDAASHESIAGARAAQRLHRVFRCARADSRGVLPPSRCRTEARRRVRCTFLPARPMDTVQAFQKGLRAVDWRVGTEIVHPSIGRLNPPLEGRQWDHSAMREALEQTLEQWIPLVRPGLLSDDARRKLSVAEWLEPEQNLLPQRGVFSRPITVRADNSVSSSMPVMPVSILRRMPLPRIDGDLAATSTSGLAPDQVRELFERITSEALGEIPSTDSSSSI